MTFNTRLNKVNLLLLLALLAALLVPVMGVATGQTVAVNELFDSDSAENAHMLPNESTTIACSCGDPGGGGNGGCC
jgi:hypothetical protein